MSNGSQQLLTARPWVGSDECQLIAVVHLVPRYLVDPDERARWLEPVEPLPEVGGPRGDWLCRDLRLLFR